MDGFSKGDKVATPVGTGVVKGKEIDPDTGTTWFQVSLDNPVTQDGCHGNAVTQTVGEFQGDRLKKTVITIQDCRFLLDIQSRDTMNEDLKALGLFGSDRLSWTQVKRLLELRLFLGLKPGRNSREQFKNTSREQIQNLLGLSGFNVDQRFRQIQEQYQNKHRVSVQLVLERE